jgi:hypothetical protein
MTLATRAVHAGGQLGVGDVAETHQAAAASLRSNLGIGRTVALHGSSTSPPELARNSVPLFF